MLNVSVIGASIILSCGKYSNAQMMTEVARMTVPAVMTKSFPFSYRRHSMLCAVGMRYGGISNTKGCALVFRMNLFRMNAIGRPRTSPSRCIAKSVKVAQPTPSCGSITAAMKMM